MFETTVEIYFCESVVICPLFSFVINNTTKMWKRYFVRCFVQKRFSFTLSEWADFFFCYWSHNKKTGAFRCKVGWMIMLSWWQRDAAEAWGRPIRLPAVGISGSKITRDRKKLFQNGLGFEHRFSKNGVSGRSLRIHLQVSLLPFKATASCGPADPRRMTMVEPYDDTAGGLDSDWRILRTSPLNTRQQHDTTDA